MKSIDPLQKLLAMPLAERIKAVDEDVRTRRDEFGGIEPHDLAQAIGIPESEAPGSEWTFTYYAEIDSVESYAQQTSPVSEIIYLIENKVRAERFNILREKFSSLDDVKQPTFDFLIPEERRVLEHAIAAEQLEGNMLDGMNCIAHYELTGSGDPLRFEADVEDDGSCIELRTPYDFRDGKFVDLPNCVTDSD